MSIARLPIYDRKGRLRRPHQHDLWAIYAAFCHGDEGGLVKVGVSAAPMRRAYAIHSNCPYPLETFVWCWAGRKDMTYQAEAFVHKQFAARQTRGEWFRFDYSEPADKREFNDTMKQTFQAVTGKALRWNVCDLEQVRLYSLLTRKQETDMARVKL